MKVNIDWDHYWVLDMILIRMTYKRLGNLHCKMCRKKLEKDRPMRNHKESCPVLRIYPLQFGPGMEWKFDKRSKFKVGTGQWTLIKGMD